MCVVLDLLRQSEGHDQKFIIIRDNIAVMLSFSFVYIYSADTTIITSKFLAVAGKSLLYA